MARIAVSLAPTYQCAAAEVMRPYCLNYQNSSGELASTRFVYDKHGLNTRAFYQEIMGGRSSINQHDFDAKNRLVCKSRKFNDGETSKELFHYNNHGRLTKESFENSKGIKGTTTYSYDAKDNAVRMDCRLYKGWLTAVLEFEFDREGKRTGGIISRKEEPDGTIAYSYDSDGNLTLEEWRLGDDWSQMLQYVYESID